MATIDGVVLKELTTHADERGFFREIVRVTDPFFGEGFAQLSHSLMYPGVAKAWHIHKAQVDWWYVPLGNLKVALYDLRASIADELAEHRRIWNESKRAAVAPPPETPLPTAEDIAYVDELLAKWRGQQNVGG